MSSPRGGGASALLTLSSQDAQHATPSGMSLQAFASQASTTLVSMQQASASSPYPPPWWLCIESYPYILERWCGRVPLSGLLLNRSCKAVRYLQADPAAQPGPIPMNGPSQPMYQVPGLSEPSTAMSMPQAATSDNYQVIAWFHADAAL